MRHYILAFAIIILFQHTSHAQLNIESLDAHLASQEAQLHDLVAGTERSIRWFDGVQKTKLSIIYLHGFSASRQELSPVSERLADQLGANVYYTRLAGHGRSDDAMAEASIEKWLNNTDEAYQIGRLIGERIIIISTSTGGTLATWLVTRSSQDILANIMISPNFGVRSRAASILKWSWGLTLARWLDGDYRSFEPISDKHGDFWTERYPIEALVPVVKLIDQIEGIDKSAVSIPQLVVYSPDDKVISPDRVIATMTEFSSSQVTLFPFKESTDPYQHVLAGDACSPESNDLMVKLLAEYVESVDK